MNQAVFGVASAMPQEGFAVVGSQIGWRNERGLLAYHKRLTHNRLLLCVVSGPGRQGAERGAAYLIEHNACCLFSTGVAGALDNSLTAGQLILPSEIVALSNQMIHVSFPLLEQIKISSKNAELACKTKEGRLLTVSKALKDQNEKLHAHHWSGANCVDMESYWFALAAKKANVPFAVARSISDSVDDELLFEPSAVLGSDGRVQIGALIRTFIQRPIAIFSMPKLALQFFHAVRTLKQVWRSLELLD
jgi:nucleoside phosphorylase